MRRHEKGNAIWFTSDILDTTDIRSYPQVVDNSVEKGANFCGKEGDYPLDNRAVGHKCVEIRHGFSTRHGGVSTLPYISDLNFGFSVGEDRETTLENYRIFAHKLGIAPGHLLCADQTHTTRVLTVDASHRSMGLWTEPASVLTDHAALEEGYDGFVTRDIGVALTVRAADCVPILFSDPENGVIGACHAGWRGTVGGIAAKVVDAMEMLGAERCHIRAAIGHAIGQCCYEIDDAFYDTFSTALGKPLCDAVFRTSDAYENPEKRHCDLRQCNRLLLLAAGLSEAHIEVSTLCTCCHPSLFHSHRYAVRHHGGKRGLMAAIISMEEIGDK